MSPNFILTHKHEVQMNNTFAQYFAKYDKLKINSTTYNSIFRTAIKESDEFAEYLISNDKNHNVITSDTATYAVQYLLIATRNYNLINQIINHYKINSLDTNIITPSIYRIAREGQVKLLQNLSDKLEIDKTPIDPESNFFQSTKIECFGEKTNLKDIQFTQNNTPLVIAQNFCSTIIILKDKTTLKIKGHEAPDVINYLTYNDFISDTYQNSENILTLYLSEHHPFFSIKSQSANFTKGFYPKNNAKKWIALITGTTIYAKGYGLITDSIGYIFGSVSQNFLFKTVSHFLSMFSTINAVKHIPQPLGDFRMGILKDEVKEGSLMLSDDANDLKVKIFLTANQLN